MQRGKVWSISTALICSQFFFPTFFFVETFLFTPSSINQILVQPKDQEYVRGHKIRWEREYTFKDELIIFFSELGTNIKLHNFKLKIFLGQIFSRL